MIKLILIICVFFLSINTSFALDYYDVETNRKYINGKKVRTMYLKDQKIEGKSLEPTINKEFQVVTNKERVIRSKVYFNKESNKYELKGSLRKGESGIIAISTNERVEMISFPRWKREDKEKEKDFKPMEEVVNQFTEEIEKNYTDELKKRQIVNKKTYVVMTNGKGYSTDIDSLWGQASGFGVLKSRYREVMKSKETFYDFENGDRLYEFVGVFYKKKLLKYFIDFNSTFSSDLHIAGQIKVGEKDYVIIFESKVDSETTEFPYLYPFENEKLGERVEPIYSVGKKLLD